MRRAKLEGRRIGRAPLDVDRAAIDGWRVGPRCGHPLIVILRVLLHGKANLLKIVPTLGTSGSLACHLNGGQQECDKDCDDRNDDEQLDQCEPRAFSSHGSVLQKIKVDGNNLVIYNTYRL